MFVGLVFGEKDFVSVVGVGESLGGIVEGDIWGNIKWLVGVFSF